MVRRILLLALMLIATSCKEYPEPFTIDNKFPSDSGPLGSRLTYNPFDDHSPSWSSKSDSVYYTAGSFSPFPPSNGLLLAAPRTPGTVRQLLRDIQPGPGPEEWLTAPAVTRDGGSIAYYNLIRHRDFGCSAINQASGTDQLDPNVAAAFAGIQDAVLEVRALGGVQQSLGKQPISFPGVTFDSTRKPPGLNFVTVIELHPFYQYYERVGPAFLRPSWSPDMTRVVYTDGLDLYLWTVGTAAPVLIPNTHDGVWPAWSPDGQWIAFTRLSRDLEDLPREYVCLRAPQMYVAAYFDLTAYRAPSPTIERIRADGTDGTVVGPGEAPAWTPSGTELVFAREGSVWRSNADGSNTRMIIPTTFASAPSVSPDGKWLAYVRRNLTQEPNDVWVAPF